MQKHFVTFESPGTFIHETTTRPIDEWDVDQAVTMSRVIKERYGAVPFAFYFTTRSRGDNDLDSKVAKRSGRYYLGGKVETLADVEARNDPKEEILRSNMRNNKIDRVVINTNGWKLVNELCEGDVVLDYAVGQPAEQT